MGTPIKNMSKLLSPRVLSPVSPNFLNILNKEVRNSRNPVFKKLDFTESRQYNHKTSVTPVKIIINDSEDRFIGLKKYDILLNTPNKKNMIKNGIGDEKYFNILGRGNFGKVFKASYKGHTVALKLVKTTNYHREKNAINLKHKNIVTILEIIESENENFSLILMEYLPNCETLQNILKSNSILFRELLEYAVNICEGLNYCHKNKILHLDLKPSNILIINGTGKICDFGNSLNTEDSEPFKHHGTIQYTAPEILLGRQPTEKSDIYSLGIIFWQLKSRKVPYNDIDNLECVIYRVVKCKLRPELDKPTDNFSQLYHQCWNQNDLERPNVLNILEKLSKVNC